MAVWIGLLCSNVEIIVDYYKHFYLSSSWQQAGIRGRDCVEVLEQPPTHCIPTLPCLGLGHSEVSSLCPTTTLGFCVPFLLESPPEIIVPCQAVSLNRFLPRKPEPCPLSLAPRDIFTFAHPNSASADHPGVVGSFFSAAQTALAGRWPSDFTPGMSGTCSKRNPGSQIFLRRLASPSNQLGGSEWVMGPGPPGSHLEHPASPLERGDCAHVFSIFGPQSRPGPPLTLLNFIFYSAITSTL